MRSQGDEEQELFAALLFNADHVSFAASGVYDYGSPCEQALVDALTAVDRTRAIRARVRRGDILTGFMAHKLERLVTATGSNPEGRRLSSMNRHQRTDRRALSTIIGDLADSFKTQWRTVDLVELPSLLSRTNVYCLSIFPIPLALAKLVDGELKNYGPYVGAVQVDSGNPIHQRLFAGLLDCVYFDTGTLYRSRWDTDEGVYEFAQKADEHFRVADLSYWDFQRAAPHFPTGKILSERGTESARRLKAVTDPTHFEAVGAAIINQMRNSATAFSIDFRVMPPDEEQLDLPVSKLLGYALNSEHATGRHKARLFSDLLGIVARDWRYLAHQLKHGINIGQLERARATEHGVQYTVFVQVVGLNGRVRTVETAWIIRPNRPAQLVTAYPADKSKQRTEPGMTPPWIDPLLTGNERWHQLHLTAEKTAKIAVAAHVPTPMQVEGYEVILDGLCGGAFVKLDGRTGLARWLVANKLAWKGYPSGIHLPARVDSQSIEKAYAYAIAYRDVLWLNGIDGAVAEKYLD